MSLYNEEIKNDENVNHNNCKAESASCLSPVASSSTTSSTTTIQSEDNSNLNRNNPFMIYYRNFMNLKLCIDSSYNGNFARFIRKACTPNCHVEHFVENGLIHFIVMSTNNIPKGSELTLPYDDIQDLR